MIIHLPQEALDAYEAYLKARTDRDDERRSFRSEKDVDTVTSALENAKAFAAASAANSE
jgi:hypothetical protein